MEEKQLIRQADQCVKCGICLPHCPTYRVTHNEGYSPRGRIALMQGIAQGKLQADSRAVELLDACLGCRYCETACPSMVEYGDLLENTRALLAISAVAVHPLVQWINRLLAHKKWLRLLFCWLWVAQRMGFLSLSRWLGLDRRFGFQRLIDMLPALSFPRQRRYRYASSQRRGSVSLFVGCTGATLGQATLQASIVCLNRLGYEVLLPKEQGCCGFLSRHQGQLDLANAMAEKNIQVFNKENSDKVLVLASGCQLALKEYPKQLDREGAQVFSTSVEDIGTFLSNTHSDECLAMALERSHSPCRVFMHRPCTQQALQEEGLYGLLKKMPGVDLSVSSNGQCCGAAGSYFLTQPAMADTLAESVIDEFKRSGAEIFLSSNMGCELHLRARLKAVGLAVKVMHSVQFLAERIGDEDKQ